MHALWRNQYYFVNNSGVAVLTRPREEGAEMRNHRTCESEIFFRIACELNRGVAEQRLHHRKLRCS